MVCSVLRDFPWVWKENKAAESKNNGKIHPNEQTTAGLRGGWQEEILSVKKLKEGSEQEFF